MKKSAACLIPLLFALSACGGGGSSPVVEQRPVAANFDGVYASRDPVPCGKVILAGDLGIVTDARPDSVAVIDNNAYRICFKSVYVGKLEGTLDMTDGSSTSYSGEGKGTFQIFDSFSNAFKAVEVKGPISGDSTGAVAKIAMIPDATSGFSLISEKRSVLPSTQSMSSLSGNYAEADYYPQQDPAPSGTLIINADGTFTGSDNSYRFNGKITRFNAITGVHAVQADVEDIFPSGRGLVTATGVIAPTHGTMGVGSDFTNLAIALTGMDRSFAVTYSKRVP